MQADTLPIQKPCNKISLFSTFPREIGFNRKWCETLHDFKQYLEENNGIKKCSISVYQQTMHINTKKYGSAIKEGAVIDKIYIDLDNTYSNFTRAVLLDWLVDETGYEFRWNTSGRRAEHDKRAARLFEPGGALGHHFYIFIEDNLKYHAFSLRNVHKYLNDMLLKRLESEYGIKRHKKMYKTVRKQCKDGETRDMRVLVPEDELPDGYVYSAIDRQIFGDVMHMSTPTNTYNPKRGCYCVPISRSEIRLEPVDLARLSRAQRMKIDDIVIGDKIWSVPSDIQEKEMQVEITDDEMEIFDINDDIINNKAFPRCIKYVLSQERPDYDARFWLMVYLREYGFSKKEVRNLMQFYIERSMVRHIITEEHTLKYVFDTTQKHRMMLNCDNFRQVLGFNQIMCQNCRRYKHNNPIYF